MAKFANLYINVLRTERPTTFEAKLAGKLKLTYLFSIFYNISILLISGALLSGGEIFRLSCLDQNLVCNANCLLNKLTGYTRHQF